MNTTKQEIILDYFKSKELVSITDIKNLLKIPYNNSYMFLMELEIKGLIKRIEMVSNKKTFKFFKLK